MMLDPSLMFFDEIDASLQELSIRNKKCDAADDDDDDAANDDDAGVMIPMCHPSFAGDTITLICFSIPEPLSFDSKQRSAGLAVASLLQHISHAFCAL